MSTVFGFKRGPEGTIPALKDGEPGFTTDTKHLWIGLSGTNYVIGSGGGGGSTSGLISYASGVAGSVTSGGIFSGTLAGFDFGSGAILAGQLGSGAVRSGDVASGQIGVYHLQSGLVTSGLYLSGSIGSGQIGTVHLASGVGGSVALTSGSVGSGALASGSVLGYLAANAPGNIASGSIGIYDLGRAAVQFPSQVGFGVIQSGNVVSGTVHGVRAGLTQDIVSGSVGGSDMASGAILSGHVGSGTVAGHAFGGAFNIASGTINNFDLASGAVLSGNIASGQIGVNHLQSGLVTSGLYLSGSIGSGQIGVYHFQSGLVASGLYLSGSIGSGQIGFPHLANASVQSGTVASGSVAAAHLASGVAFLMAQAFVATTEGTTSATFVDLATADTMTVPAYGAQNVLVWYQSTAKMLSGAAVNAFSELFVSGAGQAGSLATTTMHNVNDLLPHTVLYYLPSSSGVGITASGNWTLSVKHQVGGGGGVAWLNRQLVAMRA